MLKGVDVLYHEATFTSEMKAMAVTTQHSTAREAALIAQQAEAKRLIIGHFSSRYTDETCLLNEAREVFAATTMADEGLVVHV